MHFVHIFVHAHNKRRLFQGDNGVPTNNMQWGVDNGVPTNNMQWGVDNGVPTNNMQWGVSIARLNPNYFY